MKISKKFIEKAKIYEIFAKPWSHILDFSSESLNEMYQFESMGIPLTSPATNGFYHGKRWLNVTVAQWKKDIADGLLFLEELYETAEFPERWLNEIFRSK